MLSLYSSKLHLCSVTLDPRGFYLLSSATMEGIDGRLHPAVDGQSLGER